MNKRNYIGKTVYVGIDVHKKTYYCVSICEGEVVKRDTLAASPDNLVNYLYNLFKGSKIKSAYEAGFTGFYLHRYLVGQGIENIVVHPGSIEIASRDRVKTDKRDALKIAVQLSTNRLQGVFIPSQEREEKRSVSRLRLKMGRARHRVGVQLKSLLFTQGLIDLADDSTISQKWIDNKREEIKDSNYSEDFYYSVNEYADEWKRLTDKIRNIKKRLKLQGEKEKELQLIYESVPGIGLIHSRELANELGDMKQFGNEKQLFSYTGLTPSEHSSGENVRLGHISRQGRSVLRKILIEAAWVAISKDLSLLTIFERIAHKAGKKRAIVGVARRLVGRIRSCIATGILYQIREVHPTEYVQATISVTS